MASFEELVAAFENRETGGPVDFSGYIGEPESAGSATSEDPSSVDFRNAVAAFENRHASPVGDAPDAFGQPVLPESFTPASDEDLYGDKSMWNYGDFDYDAHTTSALEEQEELDPGTLRQEAFSKKLEDEELDATEKKLKAQRTIRDLSSKANILGIPEADELAERGYAAIDSGDLREELDVRTELEQAIFSAKEQEAITKKTQQESQFTQAEGVMDYIGQGKDDIADQFVQQYEDEEQEKLEKRYGGAFGAGVETSFRGNKTLKNKATLNLLDSRIKEQSENIAYRERQHASGRTGKAPLEGQSKLEDIFSFFVRGDKDKSDIRSRPMEEGEEEALATQRDQLAELVEDRESLSASSNRQRNDWGLLRRERILPLVNGLRMVLGREP